MRPRILLGPAFLLVSAAATALTGGAAGLWIDVPFVSQPPEGCGAAAISMIMQYWAGKDGQPPPASADVARIQSALYSPSARGIPASRMASYFEAHGFRRFAYRSDWADLERQIRLGRPLIVVISPNGRRGPLHYVVVAGVDSLRGFVFLNDPAQGKLMRISRDAFEAEWKTTDHWTLLALPQPAA